MTDIAIIGIGMHEFGRTEGASGASQGVVAIRRALADAGLQWQDIQFAAGGSMQGPPPDTFVSRLGLSGVPFTNVINGCTTGKSLTTAAGAIESGRAEIAIALGYDKHERGAFRISSGKSKGRDWYGGSGLALTTQFFGMKINRYMHQYGITQSTLAKVAEKAFRNGSLNPMAWRRKPLSEQEILDSTMLSYPLTQYMFCSPGEGGGVGAVRCQGGQPLHRPACLPPRLGHAHPPVRLVRGAGPSPYALEHTDGPTVDACPAAYEAAGIGPGDVDVAQLQDTESGAEVMHMAENGFCEHGEQEAMIQAGQTRSGDACRSTPTAGASPTANRSAHRGFARSTRTCWLRGDAGERQVPGDPHVAYTHVYGAPGILGGHDPHTLSRALLRTPRVSSMRGRTRRDHVPSEHDIVADRKKGPVLEPKALGHSLDAEALDRLSPVAHDHRRDSDDEPIDHLGGERAVMHDAPPSTSSDSAPAARRLANTLRTSTCPSRSPTTSTRTPHWRSIDRRVGSERSVVMTVVAASGPRILASTGRRRLVSRTTRSGEAPGTIRTVSWGSSAITVPTPTSTASQAAWQTVRELTFGSAADPFRVPCRRCDATVDGLRVLQHDEWSLGLGLTSPSKVVASTSSGGGAEASSRPMGIM